MHAIVTRATAGGYRPNLHRVFRFDDLPEAHRVMEANEAVGKLVVVTD
jgi:NADPH:quinone reductase-like Zn-dependent oxidoreductase